MFQAVSQALPLSRSVAAARMLVEGASILDAAPLLFGDIAIGAVYALVGLFLFHWFETQARRKGTLEAT